MSAMRDRSSRMEMAPLLSLSYMSKISRKLAHSRRAYFSTKRTTSSKSRSLYGVISFASSVTMAGERTIYPRCRTSSCRSSLCISGQPGVRKRLYATRSDLISNSVK